MSATPSTEVAEAIVQRQADAWNAKDADAFAACYAEDAVVRTFVGGEEILVRGRAEIRESYGRRFESHPKLRVVIEHRHVHDDLVTDLEFFPLKGTRATVVFRVRGKLIDRAWIFAAEMLVPLEPR